MKWCNKKIFIFFVLIFITLIIITGSAYAYWQITRTQETANDIVAACLSLDLNDISESINLENAWPISDEEGVNLTGYTFTVTNNCDEEINYIVGLNRIEEDNYLLDSSVKLSLDNNLIYNYSELSIIEYVDLNNIYTPRVSKQISVEKVAANGKNGHTIKIWVSDKAPVTEQSKIFKGQIFITGGQGIQHRDCFLIAYDGRIAGYNEQCGPIVKIPPVINGVKVSKIDSDSFKTNHALGLQAIKNGMAQFFLVYIDDTNKAILDKAMLNDVCQGMGICGIERVTDIATVLSFSEFAEYDWSMYDEVSRVRYNVVYETGKFRDRSKLIVTSLDLSQAKYLEIIDDFAFTASYESDIKDNEFCLENSDSDKKYRCFGVLQKLILPQHGMLREIGVQAFEYNLLEEVVIPSTVEFIDIYAFNGNINLREVIIKRLKEDVTLSYLSFPVNTTVVYDPNYRE